MSCNQLLRFSLSPKDIHSNHRRFRFSRHISNANEIYKIANAFLQAIWKS